MSVRSDVSCVIPVRDGERYLAAAIDSALAQDPLPREIVVVDDGSRDATREVAGRYGSRIRYVHQAAAGPAAARNFGLAQTKGSLVAFLDADDEWLPEKTRLQLSRFEARPELDLCLGHAVNFWSADVPADRRSTDPRLLAPWPARSCIVLMARRSIFERIGGFDPALAFGEDLEWFGRAGESGCVVETLPEVLARRRLHDRNVSRLHPAESRAAVLRSARAEIARRRSTRGETRS